MGTLERGAIIGQWTLEDRIGQGGLAEVWRATPADGGRQVALKIRLDPDGSDHARARFLREGRLLRRLPHAGLPRCLAVHEGPPDALALELLEGATLADRLDQVGSLPADVVEGLATSLLRVLDHLHQRGVVHRDLKPSNVWLGDNRRVLLLDLGLAADPTDPLTTTLGDVLGTFAYMAPEQIAGGEVDGRADLYGLGVTLYEALAGHRPYRADGVAGYLAAHRAGDCPPLRTQAPDAPERLVDLVSQLMARDPAARPSSAPVALGLLAGGRAPVGRLRPVPLVGRAAALGAIEAALDGGSTVFLEGEVGAGADRIAREASRMARDRGHEVLVVRCRHRSPAQAPLDQLARDLSRLSGPVQPEPAALARAVEALHGEAGALLVIEDLDQASPDAAAALFEVARGVPGLPVVITGRHGDPPGHRVPLRPLRLSETRALIGHMLGSDALPAGLGERLFALSGGLPAVVVLAVKELVDHGALWSEGLDESGAPLWRMDPQADPFPKAGLEALFDDTLAHLSPPARALLRALAVAGDPLPVHLALGLARIDPSGLAVAELERAGLITRDAQDRVAVRRPPVARLLLDRMPGSRRRALHARLATLLADEPTTAGQEDRRAWHAAHGAPPEAASAALLDLGEGLHRQGRDLDAIAVLDRAARLPEPPRGAAALAVARGEALVGAGRWSDAVAALQAGTRLAEEAGDDALALRGLVATAAAWRARGDEARAAELADRALVHLEDRPDDPAQPQALLLAASGARLRGRPEDAGALVARCLAASDRQGDARTTAQARLLRGVLTYEAGRPVRALADLDAGSRWLRRDGTPAGLVPALVRTAAALRCAGRLDRAQATLTEAEDVARFAPRASLRALAQIGWAGLHLAVWDAHEAGRRLDLARDALDPTAPARTRHAFREAQAQLRLLQGDVQAGLAALHAGEAEARAAGHVATRAWFLGMAGVLTADPHALQDAMEVLAVAGERRMAARLLLVGARSGGDRAVLQAALEEARECGDRLLLLEVLHEVGEPAALEEAIDLVEVLLSAMPGGLREPFLAAPPVRWTASGARHRASLVADGRPLPPLDRPGRGR